MKIILCAVGRLKDGPERELMARYVARFDAAGRSLALGPLRVAELAEGRSSEAAARRDDEAGRLMKACSAATVRIVLDEAGKSLDSVAFAAHLARLRDEGHQEMALLIGGPDGHGSAVMAGNPLRLALGSMTWPHGLARVLIVEQLYRATTILSGHPYHRA